MAQRNQPTPDIEALRTRLTNLSGASLDVDTVLQEVVTSARALTGARYGASATRQHHVVMASSSSVLKSCL